MRQPPRMDRKPREDPSLGYLELIPAASSRLIAVQENKPRRPKGRVPVEEEAKSPV